MDPNFESEDQALINYYLVKYAGIITINPEDKSKFLCLICTQFSKTYGIGSWGYLEQHLQTPSHLKHAQYSGEDDENEKSEPGGEGDEKEEGNKTNKKKVERPAKSDTEINLNMKYAEFIIENRLPFSIIEPFIDFLKYILANFPTEVIKKSTVSRVTLQKIIKDCICKDLKEDLYSKLRLSPFSLALDGSSDIFGSSYYAIHAKYLEENNLKQPITNLICIIPIEDSSTGSVLLEKLEKEVLIDDEIRQNLMGIASDEGSNLAGPNKGVASRLSTLYPHIVHVTDISHAYNNIFKKSLQAFPKQLFETMSSIISHFRKSPQRTAKFLENQKAMQLEPLKILRYTETRWLSLRDCLKRLLERWEVLKAYFNEHESLKKKKYCSLKSKIFFTLLLYLSEQVNYYNEYFQRNHIFVNDIISKIRESFVIFANLILKPDKKTLFFNQAFQIPFDSEEKEVLEEFILSDIQFWEQLTEKNIKGFDEVKDLNETEKQEIIDSAKKFIINCLVSMKKKLPFNNQAIIDAEIVFLKEFDKKKWEKVGERYQNIIPERDHLEYLSELGRLEYNFENIRYNSVISKANPLEMWKNLENEYPICSKLARSLFVLPHSTVSVERTFSTMKDIKTYKRSRLTVENVEACLLCYQAFKREENIITQRMTSRYRQIWSKPIKIEATGICQNKSNETEAQIVYDKESSEETSKKTKAKGVLNRSTKRVKK